MKKIYIIVFTILCSFLFVGNVRGAENLYECKYGDNTNKGTLYIKADKNLSAEFKLENWNGKENSKKSSLANMNWDATDKSSKYYVGSKGCPQYVAVQTSNVNYTSGLVWYNWNQDKAKSHCEENKSICKVLTLSSFKNPQSICYYDTEGNKIGSSQNAVYMAFYNKSLVFTTTSPKKTVQGKTYQLKETSGFWDTTTQKFKCADKVYTCKKPSYDSFADVTGKSGKEEYFVFTKESELTGANGCKTVVDDVEKDAVPANAKKNGMSSDEWIEDTTDPPTAEECKANPNTPGCAKGRCEVIDPNGELFTILKEIIGYAQIGSIFVVIILSILDLGGAIASSDDDAFRKARGKVGKRIIALILIFLVPLLINFVINLVNLGACKEEDYDFIGNLFN